MGLILRIRNRGRKEIIEWGFSFKNVNRVIAECSADNCSSTSILEKLKMNIMGMVDDMLKIAN